MTAQTPAGVLEGRDPARDALLAVVNAVRAYLPPDGISAAELIDRVIGATDNPDINPIIREYENGCS